MEAEGVKLVLWQWNICNGAHLGLIKVQMRQFGKNYFDIIKSTKKRKRKREKTETTQSDRNPNTSACSVTTKDLKTTDKMTVRAAPTPVLASSNHVSFAVSPLVSSSSSVRPLPPPLRQPQQGWQEFGMCSINRDTNRNVRILVNDWENGWITPVFSWPSRETEILMSYLRRYVELSLGIALLSVSIRQQAAYAINSTLNYVWLPCGLVCYMMRCDCNDFSKSNVNASTFGISIEVTVREPFGSGAHVACRYASTVATNQMRREETTH